MARLNAARSPFDEADASGEIQKMFVGSNGRVQLLPVAGTRRVLKLAVRRMSLNLMDVASRLLLAVPFLLAVSLLVGYFLESSLLKWLSTSSRLSGFLALFKMTE
jgi:hypothetical protein